MPEKFTVASVQMSCGPEPARTWPRRSIAWRRPLAWSANVVCLPELFQTQYFCQREDLPVRSGRADSRAVDEQLAGWRAKRAWQWLLRCLSGARRASITTRRSRLNADGACAASIARCTFPTTRSTTKSFTSRPAIWVFRPWTRPLDESARWSAGISGIRRARG